MNKILLHMTVAICLTAGGIVGLMMGEPNLAYTCFGVLSGYVIKNGVEEVKKQKSKDGR